MTKQKALDILKGLNAEELRTVAHYATQLALNEARKHFTRGASVSFVHKGEKIVGRVKKINQKSITVTVGEWAEWRVGPSLLTLEKETDPSQAIINALCENEPPTPA